MTDAEFKRELETLNDSFNRVRRISAEWHAFINGKGKARPTTELAYLFRSGSIVVKDTVALIAKVAVDKDAKNRVRMIYSHVKSCVGSLDEFIMVPTVRITADVDVVRRLFSLIHERLKDGMVDAIGGVDLKVPEYGGDNKAQQGDEGSDAPPFAGDDWGQEVTCCPKIYACARLHQRLLQRRPLLYAVQGYSGRNQDLRMEAIKSTDILQAGQY